MTHTLTFTGIETLILLEALNDLTYSMTRNPKDCMFAERLHDKIVLSVEKDYEEKSNDNS